MNNSELDKKVKNIAITLIYEKGFVCSVDVLLKLGYLSKTDYESWRFGKIPYLEKACNVNLSKLSGINKVIRQIAAELKLESSYTTYNRHGSTKKTGLVFSKTRSEYIEEAYATHYVDKKRINELKMNKTNPSSVYQNRAQCYKFCIWFVTRRPCPTLKSLLILMVDQSGGGSLPPTGQDGKIIYKLKFVRSKI